MCAERLTFRALLLISFTKRPAEGAVGHFEVLYLIVGAVLLPALAALEQVSGGATSLGHLVLADGLLGHDVSQLL